MAIPKMVVKVKKSGKEYGVEFSYGHQYFDLKHYGTKTEAIWFARMLRICFQGYEHDLKEHLK